MKIIASVEARMMSTRLAGKSMKKILGKPMLQLMIERISQSKLLNEIIVATTKNTADDEIETLCKKLSISCFRGSEDDVLDRVLKAAKSVRGDIIVELWGDSPLIDSKIIDSLITYYLKNDFDCVGTTLPNFEKTYPVGLSAIIFKTEILDKVNRLTQNPDDRENVSNYIYERPEKFKVAPLPCSSDLNFPELRLTVDEKSDFELVAAVFTSLYPNNHNFSSADVIEFLNEHPEIKSINKNVIQKRLKNWNSFE